MKNKNCKRKNLFYLLIPVGLLFAVSAIVMLLWNAILPVVIGVKTVTFWQAMGILVLSKILFGGFQKCGRGRSHKGFLRFQMMKKMKNMTPEEREIFKQKLKERYGDCSK